MSETYRLKVKAIRVNPDENGLYDLRPYGVADRYHNLTLSDVVNIYREDYFDNIVGAEKRFDDIDGNLYFIEEYEETDDIYFTNIEVDPITKDFTLDMIYYDCCYWSEGLGKYLK